MIKKLMVSSALAIASTTAVVAAPVLNSTPAGASSTVWVGGTATCQVAGVGSVAASSVYVRADSGASNSVGTSSLPWKLGRYDLTLSYLPSGGTWATAVITCPRGSLHPGAHSYRWWLKPDWRNTTGDHSQRNI